MSSQTNTLDLPCPICAEFKLTDDKTITCSSCGYTTRKLPLKVAYDYAEFVFRYGHQYKEYYETMLKEKGGITVDGSVQLPHPLHIVISLPIISGVSGNTSWFLVKTAIKTMLASYNEKFGSDFMIPEDDIRTLSKNFREFVNNFADADVKVRNAVLEEMFAAECNPKEKKKLLDLQKQADDAPDTQKNELNEKAEKLLADLMKKTFKKIGNTPKPTPEELGTFWLGVIK